MRRPAIVFVPSAKQAQLTAVDLLTFASSDDAPRRFLHAEADDVAPFLAKVKDPALSHTLAYGIGFLHEGLAAEEIVATKALCMLSPIEQETLGPTRLLSRLKFSLPRGADASDAIQVIVVVHSLCWVRHRPSNRRPCTRAHALRARRLLSHGLRFARVWSRASRSRRTLSCSWTRSTTTAPSTATSTVRRVTGSSNGHTPPAAPASLDGPPASCQLVAAADMMSVIPLDMDVGASSVSRPQTLSPTFSR